MSVTILAVAAARAIAPRRPVTVSQAADPGPNASPKDGVEPGMVLSSKGSTEPGRFRADRNPPLREPMDALSARSGVRRVVLKFPIQFGKTTVAQAFLYYVICEDPGPIMVMLPGEVTMNKWIEQKLNPLIEETPAIREAMVSTNSRNAANRREFKDFAGGQLYVEHAGSPGRLKLISVRDMVIDEADEVQAETKGADTFAQIEGRTSAFPNTCRKLVISTPTIDGASFITAAYEDSDQRKYYVPCPHCEHRQPLKWEGLQWAPDVSSAWYVCRECGCVIEEHEKAEMIRRGAWVAENLGHPTRGYQINCLYYQIGLGPRWHTLAKEYVDALSDPAKMRTFVNDRLAEAYSDKSMRAVKPALLRDRAEPYALRQPPQEVLALTVGVDTQDDRLAVQLVGWSRLMQSWTLDYVELPGDPENGDVWVSLVDLLSRPLQHPRGGLMRIEAMAIDAGGHRTEAVKNFCRTSPIARTMCIFGAKPSNAPVLSKPKLADVTWRGKTDKAGVRTYQVGTVAIKDLLFARVAGDGDPNRSIDARMVRVSDQLDEDFFKGLISETYDPKQRRYVKRSGVRNEPLDTWVYAYAAANHPDLRLHRRTKADWDVIEARLTTTTTTTSTPAAARTAAPVVPRETQQTPAPPPPKRPARSGWMKNY